MRDIEALRAYMARIVGWSNTGAIEQSMNSVTLAAAGVATLVLVGETDMVPIAQALHRRVRKPGQPFIAADPRRGDQPESIRDPASCGNAVDALEAADGGGTFCMRLDREPADLAEAVPMLRVADVMLVVCATPRHATSPLLIRPAPVVVPPLAKRAHELARVVDEYAAEASEAMGAALTADDLAWVARRAAGSLDEIDLATRRLAAVRATSSMTAAAELLGMAQVSLTRWLRRRGI